MSFVHLRTRTHRSIKEGLMDTEELVEQAVDHGHEAVALTDARTLGGAIGFQAVARKNGLKPIIGVDAVLECDLTQPDGARDPSTRLLLLAESEKGYKTLMSLITRANTENIHDGVAYIKQSWLDNGASEGLLALTGDPDHGEIPRLAVQEDQKKAAQDVRNALAVYTRLFPERLFLEVARYGHEHEDLWVQRLAQISVATKIPLVATHAAMFAERADFFAHEVHAALTSGQHVLAPEYKPMATREQYYRSTEDMQDLFSDLPQALENTVRIAQRCNATWELNVNHLPNFPVPEGQSVHEFFVKTVQDGLAARLKDLFPDPAVRAAKEPEYQARLKREIDVILNMDFPGYFLVVSDFIRWSKSEGIPVGPGRGSGAGSLVAYSLNITELDPIEHQLLFERFLNPERVSMPDIDVDFCRDRRDETIGYLFQKYGADSVSQISTFLTLGAKAALRGAARALNFPLMRVDELARMVPEELGIDIKTALEREPKLLEAYNKDKKTRRLFDMAMKIEGKAMSTGVHAGGVVIAPGRIADYSPMTLAEKGVMVTQYDHHDAEAAGLIKFDLLGLKTLTLLDRTRQLIDARPDRAGTPLDVNKISLNDPQALELLTRGDTYAVFQLESKGMSNLVKRLKPDSFEDVVALLALYRPGPLKSGMVDDFVKRKHGQAEISYFHPSIEGILKPTYGIVVYQEQVMQIAQVVAGYSLGGADLLRRAMGKKKPEEMAKERSKFESGAAKNNIDPALATELFDVMEKFAEYGFNRSHSAAYAMLSMQTAYLKAAYPAEYFAAYMNVEMGNTDVLSNAVADAKKRGLTILSPDINESTALFTPASDTSIRYGMAGLKSASEKSIDDIVAARTALGRFESFTDYLFKVNRYMRENGRNAPLKTVTEQLIRAGAFDGLHPDRAELMAAVPPLLDYLGKLNRRVASGSTDQGEVLLPALWTAVGVTPIPAPPKPGRKGQKPLVEPDWPEPGSYAKWDEFQRLSQEAKAVGFFLTGHPFQAYASQFGGLKAALPLNQISEVDTGPYEGVLLAGVISEYRTHSMADGRKMAFLSLSDGETNQDVTLFSDAFNASEHKLKVGAFIAVEAHLRPSKKNEGQKDVLVEQVMTGAELEAVLAQEVNVALTKEDLETLSTVQGKHPGNRPVTVYIPDGDDRYFRARLPKVSLSASVECLADLRAAFPDRVRVSCAPSITFAEPARANKNKNKGGNGPRSQAFRR